MNPTLSLVTGTRNRESDLRRLIASIEAYTQVPYEIIIADASDEPIGLIKTCNGPVYVIPERPRLGCTRGYNRAFAMASGDWVIWTNDDCEVTEGYAEAAIAFMEQNPHIGLGALYYSEWPHGFHVNSYYGMLYANFGIIRRSFGDQIGWWDEQLPMYGADNAFTFQVLLAGKGVDGIPNARIIHHATDDAHRRENGEYSTRMHEAEILKVKYGPLLPQIQAAYLTTQSGQNGGAQDQTPPWMWPETTKA